MSYGFESYLIYHPWIMSLVWMVLYVGDYYLTLVGARLRNKQSFYVTEGSYELTPTHQKDIDQGRKFSPRFITLLLLSTATIYALPTYLGFSPSEFGFLAGCVIVPELAVHARHMQNILLFRRLTSGRPGIQGQLTVTRECGYKASAEQFVCFGSMLFVIFLLTGSLMVLGGTITLFTTSIGHVVFARKQAKMAKMAVSEEQEQNEAEEKL